MRLVVFFVVAVIAAGCAQPDPGKEPTTSPVQSTTPVPTGGPNKNDSASGSLPPYLVAEKCNGIFGTADLPAAAVESKIPSPFVGVGYAPDTVTVGWFGLKCPRIVLGNQTLVENVGYFRSDVLVKPRNETWADNRNSWLALDHIVTEKNVTEWLGTFGHATQVGTVAIEKVGAQGRTWTASAGPATFAGEFVALSDPIGGTQGKANRWFATSGGFLKVEDAMNYLYDQPYPQSGEIRSGGTSATTSFYGPVLPLVIGAIHEISWTWTVHSHVYGSEPK